MMELPQLYKLILNNEELDQLKNVVLLAYASLDEFSFTPDYRVEMLDFCDTLFDMIDDAKESNTYKLDYEL